MVENNEDSPNLNNIGSKFLPRKFKGGKKFGNYTAKVMNN